MKNKLYEKINHFIFIDSLPKLSHYNPGQPGYEKSKNVTALTKTLVKKASDFDLKLISIKGNLLTFKNDKITLEYYINSAFTKR